MVLFDEMGMVKGYMDRALIDKDTVFSLIDQAEEQAAPSGRCAPWTGQTRVPLCVVFRFRGRVPITWRPWPGYPTLDGMPWS